MCGVQGGILYLQKLVLKNFATNGTVFFVKQIFVGMLRFVKGNIL